MVRTVPTAPNATGNRAYTLHRLLLEVVGEGTQIPAGDLNKFICESLDHTNPRQYARIMEAKGMITRGGKAPRELFWTVQPGFKSLSGYDPTNDIRVSLDEVVPVLP